MSIYIKKPFIKGLKIQLASLVFLVVITALTSVVTAQAGTSIEPLEDTMRGDIRGLQSDQEYLIQRALMVHKYLENKEFVNITNFIHPTKGVRFSMYAFVKPQSDKVFSKQQFAQYLREDKIKFTWGQQDGTGELYITTLPLYLENWLNAEVYTSYPSSISLNKFIGYGNSLNNLTVIYPNANFVELYNAGINPDYAGMDWHSLRLVFENYQGDYYLVAIIDDRWTI